jgi:hypothetical protein
MNELKVSEFSIDSMDYIEVTKSNIIRISVDNEYIDITYEEGEFRITGSDSILLQPKSSNSLKIQVKNRFKRGKI